MQSMCCLFCMIRAALVLAVPASSYEGYFRREDEGIDEHRRKELPPEPLESQAMRRIHVRFTIRRMMLLVAFVAVVMASVEFWTSEEARKSRAYCFRASEDFASYAGTLRYRASVSTTASERQQLERAAIECESTSREYWWLALQPWAEVPANPFLSE